MKITIYKLFPIVAWLILMAISTGCDTEAAEDEPGTDCDNIKTWDKDGDGISDALENNPENSIHNFDPDTCDDDPSFADGTYDSGTLIGGINLSDAEKGYKHFPVGDPPQRDDWGTLKLCSCIEATGRAWGNSSPIINILDMSLQGGGPFTNFFDTQMLDHDSHQNGLDVDIRYARVDELDIALDIVAKPSDYCPVSTKAVMVMFIQNCNVTDIFAEIGSLGFNNQELADAAGVDNIGWLKFEFDHENHYHIRLAK